MSYTVAQVEAELVDRLGSLLAAAGMAVTTGGSNASLAGPIRRAVAEVGGVVASPPSLTDADLATVEDGRLDELLDRAELRTLHKLRSWAVTTATDSTFVEGIKQSNVNRAKALADMIAALEARIDAEYGEADDDGSSSIGGGWASLGTAASVDDDDLAIGAG